MICNHTNHINLSGIWLYKVLCKTLKESSPVCSFLSKPYAEIWNSVLKVSCSELWVKRLNSGLSDSAWTEASNNSVRKAWIARRVLLHLLTLGDNKQMLRCI